MTTPKYLLGAVAILTISFACNKTSPTQPESKPAVLSVSSQAGSACVYSTAVVADVVVTITGSKGFTFSLTASGPVSNQYDVMIPASGSFHVNVDVTEQKGTSPSSCQLCACPAFQPGRAVWGGNGDFQSGPVGSTYVVFVTHKGCIC
jgi:hypothetical protein